MSLEKIAGSTKLIVTPCKECGLSCHHCHLGRGNSIYSNLLNLTPRNVEQINNVLKTAEINIEIIKIAGLAGDCFFSKKIDLIQLINSLINLLNDKERSVDKNAYPRIHLITNGLFVTREILETLKPVIPYIGFTLSIDHFHHNGSRHLHDCLEQTTEKIYQYQHLISCSYFILLAEKIKLISEFFDLNKIFVNMSEEESQLMAVDKDSLAKILGINSENIFINTPIDPQKNSITESAPTKAYNTNSIFVISTAEGLIFYGSYYDLLINHPHATLQNLVQNNAFNH